MDEKSLFEKVKSKYVCQLIFDYIKDKKLKYKLFSYSKSLQKIFGLGLIDYQELYINQLGIDLKKYISNYQTYDFNEDLENSFNDILLKYKLDINDIKPYIIKYFKNYIKEKEKEGYTNNKEISIYSPFFDILMTHDFFEKFYISINSIKKFEPKTNSIINKLNKFSKYFSFFIFYENLDNINNLKELGINLKKTKSIDLLLYNKNNDNWINITNIIFKDILPFNDIQNNLVNLSLEIFLDSYDNYNKIESSGIENINNLKSLKKLKLVRFQFINTFILECHKLEDLKLIYCENLKIGQSVCQTIKKLCLEEYKILEAEQLLKLPLLETLILRNNPQEKSVYHKGRGPLCSRGRHVKKIYFEKEYNLIIDYNSLTNLKNLEADNCEFLDFENTSLENVELFSKININEIEEKLLIEKLISMKTLKNISLYLKKIKCEKFLEIQGKNLSATKMEIFWRSEDDCILYNLQEKFPNLTDIVINNCNHQYSEKTIEIKENNQMKINNILLHLENNSSIKFYIKSYEDLISFDLNYKYKIKNIKDILPIFTDNCQVIFKSLSNLKINNQYPYEPLSLDILNNIYNNLNYMPNLKSLYLCCYYKEEDEIKIEFYKKFIKKILSIKLEYIHIVIKGKYLYEDKTYSINELKEICNDINVLNLNKIQIQKLE